MSPVKSELYFGLDTFTGNSMHKIFKNFLDGETILIDVFRDDDPELFEQLHDLWMILSLNHKYFSTPKTTSVEKEKAASTSASFTKKYPVYFNNASITHKMHITGFVIPKEIRNYKTDNILYKILKVEQAGERLHQKWNMLTQTRFFAVTNGCDKLLYTFLEYENNLYIDQ